MDNKKVTLLFILSFVFILVGLILNYFHYVKYLQGYSIIMIGMLFLSIGIYNFSRVKGMTCIIIVVLSLIIGIIKGAFW